MKRLKNSVLSEKVQLIVLIFIFTTTVVYSFVLANKRYNNFEFGKFDLGNMSQVVWNTAHRRFMEVTDQFGTNMPRWGMSHVDPILILFVPFFWLYSHPMVLVLAQHVLIVSAIFPLFWLIKKKTESAGTAFFVVLTYILYPAIGYILIWTGFHGISFVAPLFIWIVWLLEKNQFFSGKKISRWYLFVYWILIVLMLMGKEEVGAMLAIGAVFLYFKNKRLAITTFLVSIIWFVFTFFVVIPAYSGMREQSVQRFVNEIGAMSVGTENATKQNFFMLRYSYLGNSYDEMIKSLVLKPSLAAKVVLEDKKVEALNELLGPLAYVVISIPVWLISLPDLAIGLLSKEEIFEISNHRISFIVSTLFISYVYLLGIVHRFRYKKLLLFLFAGLTLVLSVYFSSKTRNPLYVSGASFLENKIVKRVFAAFKGNDEFAEKNFNKKYKIGDDRSAKVPRNDNRCLSNMVEIIDKYNPNIYSGPDYLGAHTSTRQVNALFPARVSDADLVIADFFESKILGRLNSAAWPLNKEGLRRLLDDRRYKHIYSCGKVSVFVKGETVDSSNFFAEESIPLDIYKLEADRITLNVSPMYVPRTIDRKNPPSFVIYMSRKKGNFTDKTIFWTFENVENPNIRVSFIDYISIGSRESIDRADLHQPVVEIYAPILDDDLLNGRYRVFLGVGDLLNAKEIYIGEVEVF